MITFKQKTLPLSKDEFSRWLFLEVTRQKGQEIPHKILIKIGKGVLSM